MNMNDPKDCPKRMEFPIRFLEIYKDCTGAGEKQDQITRAIALLKAHESMCECGTMPGDGNAALWDLERSLAIHKDMHTAFQGTPKGEYHARSIREIEDALTILRNRCRLRRRAPEWPDIIGAGPMLKTSNLTFGEALEAVKRGKKVRRGASGITLKGGSDMDLNVSFGDIASTNWSIVEER